MLGKQIARYFGMSFIMLTIISLWHINAQETICQGGWVVTFTFSGTPAASTHVSIEGETSNYTYDHWYDSSIGSTVVSVHFNDGGWYNVKYWETLLGIKFNKKNQSVNVIATNKVVAETITDEQKIFKASNSVKFQPGFHFTASSSAYNLKGLISDCSGNPVGSSSVSKSQFENSIDKNQESLIEKKETLPKELSIYPNPTHDIIHIGLPDPSGQYEVRIFSSKSNQVYRGLLQGNSMDVNLSEYPKGLYMLQIIGKDGLIYNKKVLKE